MSNPPLALLLLQASRWFDEQLLDTLEQRGWPRLTSAQSLVFAHLPAEGIAPAGLARRLGHTRQATSDLLTRLVRFDLLALTPDPARRAGRLVQLTVRGRALARDAYAVLAELEQRYGAERSAGLRALLTDVATPTAVVAGARSSDGSGESAAHDLEFRSASFAGVPAEDRRRQGGDW